MELDVSTESWPIRGEFAISRGAKKEALVIVATIRNGEHFGRGECVPYARYGETIESVQKQIESVGAMTRESLQAALPAGAARNALDCALWDLECKQKGKTIWDLIGITPKPMPTWFTISIDTPEKMAENARRAAQRYQILKLKLGAEGDQERLARIREAVPDARLIVDANEGWNEDNIEEMLQVCESARVELIEQPLPARSEYSNILQNYGKAIVLICADEVAHTSEDISRIVGTYSAVNIKLDKTGGLTEALATAREAKKAGLKIMVGCMVSTSLSMAPATVVAQYADYVDLDGPLLLEKDREPAVQYEKGIILPTKPALWG